LKLDFDSLGSNLSGLDRLEIRRRNFVFSFRAIFLVSGLFCLYVLLAEGYDQFCTSGCPKGEMDISMPICLLFCSFGVFIISGLIFLNSFGHKKTSEQGYNGFWIGVFFILFAYFSISLEKHLRPIIIYSLQWNPRLIITFPVLAAVFPYILHIIRVILHKLKFSFLKSKVLIKMFVCSRALYLANNQKNTKKNTTEWVADIYKKHKGFFWKPTLEAIKTKITGDLNKVLALVFIAVHERNVRPVYSKNIMVRSLQKMYLWWR
jgi:hypothetical protein